MNKEKDSLLQAQATDDRWGWKIVLIPLNGQPTTILKTFPSPEAEYRYLHHTYVAETSDGRIHAFAGVYTRPPNHFLYSFSDDNGETWSDPTKTLEVI